MPSQRPRQVDQLAAYAGGLHDAGAGEGLRAQQRGRVNLAPVSMDRGQRELAQRTATGPVRASEFQDAAGMTGGLAELAERTCSGCCLAGQRSLVEGAGPRRRLIFVTAKRLLGLPQRVPARRGVAQGGLSTCLQGVKTETTVEQLACASSSSPALACPTASPDCPRESARWLMLARMLASSTKSSVMAASRSA